jgi:hypothetical protein
MERVADVVRDLLPRVLIAARPLDQVRIAGRAAPGEAALLIEDLLPDVGDAPLERRVEGDRRNADLELRRVRPEVGEVVGDVRELGEAEAVPDRRAVVGEDQLDRRRRPARSRA